MDYERFLHIQRKALSLKEKFILRCIEIAKNGLGTTRPNPMVGSVIVHNNTIIGEGFTSPYGGNHAEVNAIQSVKNKSLLKEATLYVTLEPCSHFGKTPPCTSAILDHGIKNIVIGTKDLHEKVAGKGISTLKAAGCKLIVGVLEEECREHHKRFFTFHDKKRPHIILKWAETVNGYIAPLTKKESKPEWISNAYSRQLTHKWRAEEQSILIGTNTVLQDNPSLTTRDWKGENPVRVVIDRENKLPKTLNIFNDAAKTIIIHDRHFFPIDNSKPNLNFEIIDFSKNVAQQICDVLYSNTITSVIIEGGQQTLQTFIDENLWDEARVFTGNVSLKKGIKAPRLAGKLVVEKQISRDILKIFTND